MDTEKVESVAYTVLRYGLGWIFLWAAIDKTFGITAGTISKGYLGGASPTKYFLGVITANNPIGQYFAPIAGNPIVDFLFIAGLWGLGLSLILGLGRRIAGITGPLLMLLMWATEMPVANNPFMDDHLIYALVFIIIGFGKAKGVQIPQFETITEKYPWAA